MIRFTVLLAVSLAVFAQSTGTVRGKVTLAATGDPVHSASVLLSPLGRTLSTNDSGEYVFQNVPPGNYDVVAHMHALSDEKKKVTVAAGATATADFVLSIAALKEAVTVTASGREVTALEAFQSVTSKEGYELTVKSSSTSLGDLLDNETGIAKRSYGAGNSRPVVRGFDGDRVLVLQDGIRTGTLSSQSGDHGEPVDATVLERVEVVRGPAALLYGSNAIGGVVNVMTSHHMLHEHPHEGLHATVTGVGGTANGQGGMSGNFEYGRGDWLLTASGGGTRMGDYMTPIGKIENSLTNMKQGSVGGGHYGEKIVFNANYGYQSGLYGVPPFDPTGPTGSLTSLDWRRQNVRLNAAVKRLGASFDEFQLALNYSDWNHKELEGETVGTQFFNKQFIYRGVLQQKKRGPLSGSLGFWGMRRDYEAKGAEALTPPVTQNGFAAFALEELSFDRIKLQFGSRLETNKYALPDSTGNRKFTGVSGSAGANIGLWTGGSFVASYMHSFRAPALEELYNFGPHPGNFTWEIGNRDLLRETGDGVEVSLRQQARRVRFETNLFRYKMTNFVYLQPRGAVLEGLPVADYAQSDSRFLGAEARVEFAVRPSLWLLLGFDAVDAQLSANNTPLPRIPPVRGRAGFDWRYKSLSLRPELILTNKQHQLAPNETGTAGYVVGNVTASYNLIRKHTLQTFSANFFNVGDTLYRNHLSFIKDFAPEIGRGVRVGYTLQWF